MGEPFPRLCPPRTCPHQDPQLQPLPRQLAPLLPRMGGGRPGRVQAAVPGRVQAAIREGGLTRLAPASLVVLLPELLFCSSWPWLSTGINQDEQASLADDVDRITIEAEAARPQPTPVDQASMSSGVNDMSMVEAPASMVTDVQEKIIEADL